MGLKPDDLNSSLSTDFSGVPDETVMLDILKKLVMLDIPAVKDLMGMLDKLKELKDMMSLDSLMKKFDIEGMMGDLMGDLSLTNLAGDQLTGLLGDSPLLSLILSTGDSVLGDAMNAATTMATAAGKKLIGAVMSRIHIPETLFLLNIILMEKVGGDPDAHSEYLRRLTLRKDLPLVLAWLDQENKIVYGYNSHRDDLYSAAGNSAIQVVSYIFELILKDFNTLDRLRPPLSPLSLNTWNKEYHNYRSIFHNSMKQLLIGSYSNVTPYHIIDLVTKSGIKPSAFGTTDKEFGRVYELSIYDIERIAPFYKPISEGFDNGNKYIDPNNINIKEIYVYLSSEQIHGNDRLVNEALYNRLKHRMITDPLRILDAGMVNFNNPFEGMTDILSESIYNYTKKMEPYLYDPKKVEYINLSDHSIPTDSEFVALPSDMNQNKTLTYSTTEPPLTTGKFIMINGVLVNDPDTPMTSVLDGNVYSGTNIELKDELIIVTKLSDTLFLIDGKMIDISTTPATIDGMQITEPYTLPNGMIINPDGTILMNGVSYNLTDVGYGGLTLSKSNNVQGNLVSGMDEYTIDGNTVKLNSNSIYVNGLKCGFPYTFDDGTTLYSNNRVDQGNGIISMIDSSFNSDVHEVFFNMDIFTIYSNDLIYLNGIEISLPYIDSKYSIDINLNIKETNKTEILNLRDISDPVSINCSVNGGTLSGGVQASPINKPTTIGATIISIADKHLSVGGKTVCGAVVSNDIPNTLLINGESSNTIIAGGEIQNGMTTSLSTDEFKTMNEFISLSDNVKQYLIEFIGSNTTIDITVGSLINGGTILYAEHTEYAETINPSEMVNSSTTDTNLVTNILSDTNSDEVFKTIISMVQEHKENIGSIDVDDPSLLSTLLTNYHAINGKQYIKANLRLTGVN